MCFFFWVGVGVGNWFGGLRGFRNEGTKVVVPPSTDAPDLMLDDVK